VLSAPPQSHKVKLRGRQFPVPTSTHAVFSPSPRSHSRPPAPLARPRKNPPPTPSHLSLKPFRLRSPPSSPAPPNLRGPPPPPHNRLDPPGPSTPQESRPDHTQPRPSPPPRCTYPGIDDLLDRWAPFRAYTTPRSPSALHGA